MPAGSGRNCQAAEGRLSEGNTMKEKIERFVIAACIGAIVACGMAWVIFFPVLA
jgi:hypothetical protein